jgi:HEAT repeat protein
MKQLMLLLNNRSWAGCAAVALALAALFPASARAQATPNSADKERQLIEVLRSGAPDQKAIACKQLAVYGSAQAVPVLAPLLEDMELASWARIALEAIPGEAADAALRQAIPKLQGLLLVGTINSIGVRQDAQAVNVLSAHLKDADPDVASAAAVALGRIGGPEAAVSLKGALTEAPTAVRAAVAEGCVRCAEKFLAGGQAPQAIELYDAVRQAPVPKQNQLEGIRGAILARGDEGIPLLVEQLRSGDKALFQIGLRVARELPGSKATETVVAEMRRAPEERQPLLLLALADRNEEDALPPIIEAAKSGPRNLRLVAVGALDRLSKPATAPALVDIAAGNDPALTQAALMALTRMPGSDLDAQFLQHLQQAEGKTRQVLIQVCARRQVEGALPLFLKDTQSSDAGVRSAAVQAVGAVGGTGQINDLVTLLSSTPEEKQRDEIETALLAISSRGGNGGAQNLLPLLQNQDSSVRKVALHALASAGGPAALEAIQRSVEDKDQAIQDDAVRTLSTWPNTWPEDQTIAQPLLALAKTSNKPTYQVLALRGYLQFLQGDKKLGGAEKLMMVQEVLPLMNRPEEKRSAIAVLQSVPTSGSLEMLVKFAAEPELTEDACSALVDLAGKGTRGVSVESRRLALQTALDKSANETTKTKATQALARIR